MPESTRGFAAFKERETEYDKKVGNLSPGGMCMTADRKKTSDTADFRKVSRSGGNGRAWPAEGRAAGMPRFRGGAGMAGRQMEIDELVDAVRALPDVRVDKVEAIRTAIESGTYVVDARKVAEKMIEELG